MLGFRDLGRLGFLPYEHFIPVTTDESGMNSGGPDGIVLHNLVPRGRDPFGQRRGSVPIFPAHDKRDPWGRGCVLH